jgi:hypothetical protein
MNQQIAFRRVRGHVIPIKIDGKKSHVNATHNTAQGAVEVGAGAGVAAYAGSKAHQLLRKAGEVERLAKLRSSPNKLGQMSLFRARGSEKLFKLSTRLHRGRNLALLAGGIVGGALITKGVHDILKDNKHLSKHPEIKKAATVTGGFGLALTAATVAYGKKVMPTASLKKVFEYAKARKTIQYAFRGI